MSWLSGSQLTPISSVDVATPDGPPNGVDVGRQIGVRQRHAFRRGRRSRRELHERDVVERRPDVGLERPSHRDRHAQRTSDSSGHSTARAASNDGASARVVTTARAPDARRMAAVSSKYRGSSPIAGGGYSDAGVTPARDAPNSAVQELFGVGQHERDEIAAPQPGLVQRPRHPQRGVADVRVRTPPVGVAGHEAIAGVGAGGAGQRLGQRARCGHQPVVRSPTRRATSATTCATVRVAGTLSSGIEMSNTIFELGDELEHLQRIEPEVGDEIVVERRFDRPAADVFQRVDHAIFDPDRGWTGHRLGA